IGLNLHIVAAIGIALVIMTLAIIYLSYRMSRVLQTAFSELSAPLANNVDISRYHSIFDKSDTLHQLIKNKADTIVQIEQRNDQFNRIFESMQELVIVVKNDHTVVSANPSADTFIETYCGSHNTDPEPLIGRLLDPQRIFNVKKNHPFIKETGTISTLDSIYSSQGKHVDKSIHWKRATLTDDNNKRLGYVYTGIDTTQSKVINENLRIRNQAIEAAPDGIAILDITDGLRIIYCNPSMEKITGYAYHEIIGQNWTLTCGKKTSTNAITTVGEAIKLNEAIKIEIMNYRKSGDEFWNRLSFSPIFDSLGNITHYLCIQSDVTQQIESQKQLEQAIEKSEKANKIKSEFLANMSHEIRTPMNAILGISNLCLMTKMDNKQQYYLEKINQSGSLLLSIINDILDCSKIEAGKMVLEKMAFSLADIFQRINVIIEIETKKKGLSLDFDLSLLPCHYFIGDTTRLQQILINLVSNAVKFTEQGGVSIQVKAIGQENKKTHLQFTVKDSGIGMTQGQCDRVFTSFSQADNSITRQYGGSGLGLTISKSLIEMMNGSIHIKSSINIGTSVIFDIKLVNASEGEVSQSTNPTSIQKPQIILHHQHILIVEDNLINQQVAKELVEKMGATVSIADNGQKAIDYLEKNTVDCVLMDLQMPIMDGYTATKVIRDTLNLKDLPIIALTANAGPGDRRQCMDAGMNEHISKPIDIAQLERMFKQFIMAPQDSSKENPTKEKNPLNAPIKAPENPLEEPSVQPSVQSSKPSALYDIPSINSESALKRLANKHSLLDTLLHMFFEEHHSDIINIKTHIEQENFEDARQTAHALKGVTGSIGALDVFTHVSALESVIKSGQHEHIDLHFIQLEKAFNTLYRQLDEKINHQGSLKKQQQ
ncbi:ATP-binding protein, partial [bacterium]|nr:ATP-binding protein [bacterium]